VVTHIYAGRPAFVNDLAHLALSALVARDFGKANRRPLLALDLHLRTADAHDPRASWRRALRLNHTKFPMKNKKARKESRPVTRLEVGPRSVIVAR
jgi:hypothetical protein